MPTRWWNLALVVPLILAGCGGDDDDAVPEATTGSTGAPATTAGGAAGAALPCGTDTPAGTALAYDLSEFEVDGPTSVAAGEVGLSLANTGEANHQITIIEGPSYEALPVNANGTVEIDQLPAGAVVAATDRFPGGGACDVSVDLDPGTYVLVCNIEFQNGPQVVSHAGRGMHSVLTVT